MELFFWGVDLSLQSQCWVGTLMNCADLYRGIQLLRSDG